MLKNEKSQIYPENNNFYIIPQKCLQEMVVQKHVNNGHFLLVLEHYFPRNFEHCLFFKLNFYDICKTRFINLKKKMYWRARVLFLTWTFCGCLCNVVRLSPSCSGNVCEFEWTIDYKFTMMWYNKTTEDPEYQPIVQDSIGFVKRRSTTQDCEETHTVVTLSGSYFFVL